MIHFPMQLALALVALRLGWVPQTFQSVGVLAAFYVVLIVLGLASYHFFERPLQSLIRRGARWQVSAASDGAR
jgi:peptidoglycan/LPS O-acetylase OafA/YrhL